MKIISPDLVKNKKVLLRLDLDVPVENGKVINDFRLRAAKPTLNLCLENASKVVIIGHLGRPGGVEIPELSVAPIYEWLKNQGYSGELGSRKLKLLENLRFEKGEDEVSFEYAHSLIDLVDPESHGDVVFINEAFATYHPAASTTVLPKLLPHAAGLRFAEEVRVLRDLRGNPKRPLVAIIGGVKIEDKMPAIEALSKIANTVLVGGKLVSNITYHATIVEHNVMLGKLNEAGDDVTEQTLDLWEGIIKGADQIIWNGPAGKIEDGNLGSAEGTYKIAKMILGSKADVVVGGGDTVGFLGKLGMLEDFEKKGFISTGGGAMLEFLTDGTLPSIEALNK